MKIILFLLLIITPHLRSEILSKTIQVSEKIIENGPTAILNPIKRVHDKILPQDLKETLQIYQNLIEDSLTKKTDLKVNTTTWLKFIPDFNKTYPSHFDWREYGAVTPVKFQTANCSSDWAFSAVGAIEGQNFRKNGKLQDLSVQQVLDCSKNFNNGGCDGGFIHQTFEYVKSTHGIMSEASYPYQGKNGDCQFKPEDVVAKIKGYVYIEKGNEKALEAAVASVGPIAVALGIKAKPLFFAYKDGVFFDPECGKESGDLTFGALIVGYGEEEDGQKYWWVKSSYSTKWGIDGYMKLAKDVGNHCGVATYASFPLV